MTMQIQSASLPTVERSVRPAQESAPSEIKLLRELKQRDREVRTHEQAHAAAGGQHVSGGPSYSYQRGPDGRQYAVGGEVQIDTSAVPGDSEATMRKMQQVQRAALAPAEPSAQDLAIAAEAAQKVAQARIDMQHEIGDSYSDSKAIAAYASVESAAAELPKSGEFLDLQA